MIITNNNDPTQIFENHFTLKCPNCQTFSNISAVSIPQFEFLSRFKPEHVAIGYRCDACNEPICLKYSTRSFLVSGFIFSYCPTLCFL